MRSQPAPVQALCVGGVWADGARRRQGRRRLRGLVCDVRHHRRQGRHEPPHAAVAGLRAQPPWGPAAAEARVATTPFIAIGSLSNVHTRHLRQFCGQEMKGSRQYF